MCHEFCFSWRVGGSVHVAPTVPIWERKVPYCDCVDGGVRKIRGAGTPVSIVLLQDQGLAFLYTLQRVSCL
jgi:hypothetical protein